MNKKYFFEGLEFIPEYIIGILILYVLVIIYINLLGLKSFSKMSSYDFAHTIAIGSLIASSIATGKPSLFVGLFLIGFLFLVKYIISFLQKKSSWFEGLVNNKPLLLMQNGAILEENLKKSRVSKSELIGKLREANVFQFSEVKAVVLENTGDISVLHSKEETNVDDEILEGVNA